LKHNCSRNDAAKFPWITWIASLSRRRHGFDPRTGRQIPRHSWDLR